MSFSCCNNLGRLFYVEVNASIVIKYVSMIDKSVGKERITWNVGEQIYRFNNTWTSKTYCHLLPWIYSEVFSKKRLEDCVAAFHKAQDREEWKNLAQRDDWRGDNNPEQWRDDYKSNFTYSRNPFISLILFEKSLYQNNLNTGGA